jgi:hypothetical protein
MGAVRLAAVALLALVAWAQPVLDDSPNCPGTSTEPCVDTTYSSATSIRVFVKYTARVNRLDFRCGPPGWTTASLQREMYNFADPGAEGLYITLNALAPSTAYECQIGASLFSDATHAVTWHPTRLSYTTPAWPSDAGQPLADPATFDTSYPTITNTYTVGADCNDVATGLQAKMNEARAAHTINPVPNHKVVVPAGTICTGKYNLASHTAGPGYIVVQSSAVGTPAFPPEGVRLDPTRYEAQLVRLRMPKKDPMPGKEGQFADGDAAFYITDNSGYIRFVGVVFEPEPVTDAWSYRPATCTYSAGNDVSVNAPGMIGSPHNLLTGRTVRVDTAATLTGLQGNTYTIVSTGSTTFTLDNTDGITGSTGACQVSIRADAGLTSCTAGTGGAIRCTTSVPHGIVTDTVVKVIGDLSYGFATTTTMHADVIDTTTLEFRGTTATGSYTADSARLVIDGFIFGKPVVIYESTPGPSHVIFDRCWFRHPGPPYQIYAYLVSHNGSYGAVINSHVDPNQQWTFTEPGTLTDRRPWAYVTNGANYAVNQQEGPFIADNNYLGWQVLGLSSTSDNVRAEVPHDFTIRRNTVDWPDRFRLNSTNANRDGFSHTNQNRQGLEFKSGIKFKVTGNRFYGNSVAGNGGVGFLFSCRAGAKIYNRCEDITVSYNTIVSGAAGHTLDGNSTTDNPRVPPVMKRVRVHDNITNVDGNLFGYGGTLASAHGWYLRTIEDMVFEHNATAQRGAQQQSWHSGGHMGGVKVRNNIFTYNHGPYNPFWKYQNTISTTSTDEYSYPDGAIVYPTTYDVFGFFRNTMVALGDSLATAYPHMDSRFEFTNNAMIVGNKGNGAGCDSSSSTGCNATKADCDTAFGSLISSGGNMCFNAGGSNTFLQRVTAVSLNSLDRTVRYQSSSTQPDFRLRYDSPFKSGATSASNALCSSGQCLKASDGSDLGPDMDALEAAQGLVKGPWIAAPATDTTISIGYTAPDAAVCHVDYWTGSDDPTRASDSGGARNRVVALTSLTAGSLYTYRLQCVTTQPDLTFWTRAE